MKDRTLMVLLTAPAGRSRTHILTVTDGVNHMSTAITGSHVEHPQVLRILNDMVRSGSSAGITLRTFLEQRTPDGRLPLKQLRGWNLTAGRFVPIAAVELAACYETDAVTGAALSPPGHDLTYHDAHPVAIGSPPPQDPG